MNALFPPSEGARLFALPPGADFASSLVEGLTTRMEGQPPLLWAQTEIYLNTERARRRLAALLEDGPIRLQPTLRTLAEIGQAEPPFPPLKRRLELARPIRKLLETAENAGARTQAFDLADSLATLMEEMQSEGVPWAALAKVNPETLSTHWQRSLQFLTLIRSLLELPTDKLEDAEARRRAALLAQAAEWTANPQGHPVLIAGSTGSRGATPEFMAAAAGLPNGAVILPGLDPHLPPEVWHHLQTTGGDAIDHPQWGLARLAALLDQDPETIPHWSEDHAPNPARGRLAALALRPAPVTDQWLTEGPALIPELEEATQNLTLVEAPTPRDEAQAIALLFRQALAEGTPTALITPDRTLARRVTAEMDRWGIAPDDSAGRPLSLTPPGVFLRRTLALSGWETPPPTLIGLLKHPLTSSAPEARAPHMEKVRALELEILRHPTRKLTGLTAWAEAKGEDWPAWAGWLVEILGAPLAPGPEPVEARLTTHISLAETLAQGPTSGPSGLWEAEAGKAALKAIEKLTEAAPASDPLDLAEYRTLFTALLSGEDVPDAPYTPHPGIAIWGTLEARTQSAPRIILGGLNEGTWPRLPKPDPWLNRAIRAEIGLPPAERQIGLSAHDFQQGFGAREVILTRSTRDADAPTVPSRWVLRLENLLSGLGEEGQTALTQIRTRGKALLTQSALLESTGLAPPATRPAPVPPLSARPGKLPATQIEKLIRDPYAIYARYILRLRPLEPLGRDADARERGIAFHTAFERFISATRETLPGDAPEIFRETMASTMEELAPWPAIRALWQTRLTALTEWFLEEEVTRRARATPALLEATGKAELPGTPAPFTLEARADRIDIGEAGIAIYDYKGSLPSGDQLKIFNQQLQLEACIAQRGGFEKFGPTNPIHLEMIGLGGGGDKRIIKDPFEATAKTWADLITLITTYQTEGTPYPARLRPDRLTYESDYDHLSRLGEWIDGTPYEEGHVP